MSKKPSHGRVVSWWLRTSACLAALAAIGCGSDAAPSPGGQAASTSQAATATPAFVQVNAATPQSPQSSVAVAYGSAQTAADLDVVIVGWSGITSSVSAGTDSPGNASGLAMVPSRGINPSQSFYSEKNVAAGSNTVTVKFS